MVSAVVLGYVEIALGFINKHLINAFLCDVSKAFSKIWHYGLKYRLEQLQLPTHLTRLPGQRGCHNTPRNPS